MAINKKLEFSLHHIRLAEFAKAMSHPARLAIIQTLAEKQMCICGEIVEVMPLAQATVSQHLKELKNIGLVSGEVDGVKSCYCLNWEAIEQLATEMNQFLEQLQAFKPTEECC